MIRRFLLDNWKLKLISILLAAALLLFVRGEHARQDSVGAHVKLVLKNIPDDRVLVSTLVEKLVVTLRGPRSRIQELARHELPPVEIDAARAKAGPIRFTSDQLRLPRGIQAVSISPPEVDIRFEDRIERSVPVKVTRRGDPPRGYRLEQLAATPPSVVVTGARSQVEAIHAVATDEIGLENEMKGFERTVRLVLAGPHRSLATEQVSVRAVIAPVLDRRRMSSVPVRLLSSLEGRADSKLVAVVEPSLIDIDIEGPLLRVEALREADIQAVVDVRYRALAGPDVFSAAARIDNLPIDVRPIGFHPQRFTVSVRRRR